MKSLKKSCIGFDTNKSKAKVELPKVNYEDQRKKSKTVMAKTSQGKSKFLYVDKVNLPNNKPPGAFECIYESKISTEDNPR
jgi:hypothetical protein